MVRLQIILYLLILYCSSNPLSFTLFSYALLVLKSVSTVSLPRFISSVIESMIVVTSWCDHYDSCDGRGATAMIVVTVVVRIYDSCDGRGANL